MGLLLKGGAKRGGRMEGEGKRSGGKRKRRVRKRGGKGSTWASASQKQIFWLRRC